MLRVNGVTKLLLSKQCIQFGTLRNFQEHAQSNLNLHTWCAEPDVQTYREFAKTCCKVADYWPSWQLDERDLPEIAITVQMHLVCMLDDAE